MAVILTGRRPTSWWCVETGHHSSSCAEKKASGRPVADDQNPSLAAPPVMDVTATPTGAEKTSVGSRPTLPTKPKPSASADKKEKWGWRVVGRASVP